MTLISHRFGTSNGVSLLLSLLAVNLGVTVVTGWAFGIAALKSVLPGLVHRQTGELRTVFQGRAEIGPVLAPAQSSASTGGIRCRIKFKS
jgi:hypothetical protein